MREDGPASEMTEVGSPWYEYKEHLSDNGETRATLHDTGTKTAHQKLGGRAEESFRCG